MPKSRAHGTARGRGHGRGQGQVRTPPRRSDHNSAHGTSSQSHQSRRFDQFDDQEINADLPERFRGRAGGHHSQYRDQSPIKRSNIDLSLNTDIRKYVQDQNALQAEDKTEGWIEKPELPEHSEICLGSAEAVELAGNKPNKKFKNVGRYLKTHYELLREDAVGPLRDAVDRFRKNPLMDDDQKLSVYEKVHISGFTFTNMGIAARLRFSIKRAGRKIMWSASKRLVSGSLVALTPTDDNFATQCIVAIIAARPLGLLEQCPPEVDIYFSCIDDIRVDPQVSYIMIEAKQGYYEAHRHTLRALQKLSKESFPLSQHIIGSELEIGQPDYLSEWPNRSLTAVVDDGQQPIESLTSVDIIKNWPATPDSTTLDHSQWDALQQILTRKLAIIQGPPGTGKTHVSKVALQIMTQNRAEGDPPIIVAAQTNHALDQLLKHVSKFDPEFVRLGGRSTSVEVKKRALYEVRRHEVIPAIPGSCFKRAVERIEEQKTKYGDLLSIFDEKLDLIPGEKLMQLGVINAKQYQSLLDAANNLVTSINTDRNPMKYWLDQLLVPFVVTYEDDSLGLEDLEEDLEFEQLQETEAEHGVSDEEDLEMLKGVWRSVADRWTVNPPSENELEKAKNMLDTKDNLWDIPDQLRGAVYLVMKSKAKLLTLERFKQEAIQYQKVVGDLKIGKWEKDVVYLRRANIIGMTTTGLSKYRPLIASLRPKIILIEEAAEVIEGPVTAACMESVEHLILVGDHQQLQGHCALLDLENHPFYLNVSMFERLVNLKIPFKTLTSQRRMLPEIRELISPLYSKLEDHPSILSRTRLPFWGTGNIRSFFFHHDWLELKDQTMSTYNEEEARMVAKFYRHLLRNGVAPAAISILTFYNGQRKRILRELRDDPETNASYNNVKTVDSYQGEENHIIILSLVRSNTQGQLGFLDINNRVCVALSRARDGFYLFGNAHLLSGKNTLWANVQNLMSTSTPVRFGPWMPLICSRHKRQTIVQWPEDFDRTDGGCDAWCNTRLECGHICPLKCHPKPHELLLCRDSCSKVLPCGHPCAKKCHEVCYCDCDDFQPAFQTSSRSSFDSSARKEDFEDSTAGRGQADVNGGSASPATSGPVNKKSRPTMRNPTGRTLARGGAAFQPILSDPLASSRSSDPKNDTISVRETATIKANPQQDWTSFASGGVKKDDVVREESRDSEYGIANDMLIDLSPEEDRGGVIETSNEQKIDGNRSKFTQTYRPTAPGGLGGSNSHSSEKISAKSSDRKQVLNLMD